MSFCRPAGYSDDEDDDDDFEFSTGYDDGSYRNYVHEKQESKEDLFYNALTEGNLEEMKVFIDNGFNVETALNGGWTALLHACLLGHFPVVEFLITNGANVNFNVESFSPLMALCKSNSVNEDELVKCLNLLSDQGANLNAIDRNATTPLMYASMSGRTELVRKLVDLKCDLNIQDVEGWSALFHAVNGGHEEIVRILINGKARVDLIDRRRRSAFELATLKGFNDIGKLVCSKKERRKLLAAEESTEVVQGPGKPFKDPIEELMAQLPSASAKNSSGFSSDVSKLLWSMGLGHLSKQFSAENVQLNEFLLITDERLKELGVRFSVHRQRILNSIRKFHLHSWNKSSLGLKPRNQQINMDDAVKVMCNITKHLHVLDASVNYFRNYQPIPIRPEIFKMCENAAHQLTLISGELKNIQHIALKLKIKEPIEPVDLIKPKIKTKNNYFHPLIVTSVFIGLIVWKRTYFLSLPIVQAFYSK